MKAEKAELVGGVYSQAGPVLSKVWAGPTLSFYRWANGGQGRKEIAPEHWQSQDKKLGQETPSPASQLNPEMASESF